MAILPKKGAMTLNDKGKWLVAQKDAKKAKWTRFKQAIRTRHDRKKPKS